MNENNIYTDCFKKSQLALLIYQYGQTHVLDSWNIQFVSNKGVIINQLSIKDLAIELGCIKENEQLTLDCLQKEPLNKYLCSLQVVDYYESIPLVARLSGKTNKLVVDAILEHGDNKQLLNYLENSHVILELDNHSEKPKIMFINSNGLGLNEHNYYCIFNFEHHTFRYVNVLEYYTTLRDTYSKDMCLYKQNNSNKNVSIMKYIETTKHLNIDTHSSLKYLCKELEAQYLKVLKPENLNNNSTLSFKSRNTDIVEVIKSIQARTYESIHQSVYHLLLNKSMKITESSIYNARPTLFQFICGSIDDTLNYCESSLNGSYPAIKVKDI